MKRLNALPVMIVLAGACSLAQAAADFTTIRRAEADLNDNVPLFITTFNLPSTVYQVDSTANSAVLTLDVFSSQYFFNRVYVNPPTHSCTANQNDANEAAAIGYLQSHADINMQNEWAVNHITFSSALLLPGTNVLLVCNRTSTGDAGSGVTGLDAMAVRNIELQFHNTK
jgi:hypothetical protein